MLLLRKFGLSRILLTWVIHLTNGLLLLKQQPSITTHERIHSATIIGLVITVSVWWVGLIGDLLGVDSNGLWIEIYLGIGIFIFLWLMTFEDSYWPLLQLAGFLGLGWSLVGIAFLWMHFGALAPDATATHSANMRHAQAVAVTSVNRLLLEALLVGIVATMGLLIVYRLLGTLLRMTVSLAGLFIAGYVTIWIGISTIGVVVDIVGKPINEQTAASVLAMRNQRIQTWVGPRIAVTLSGGGYRAALFHAGVLAQLDAAGLPIRYLSTVSGGSIVGASYATGWTPEAFRLFLSGRRPGLVDDYLNAVMLTAVSLRGEGTSGILKAHIERRFVSQKTLGDAGPPKLIINSTRYIDGNASAFWGPVYEHVSLAGLVSASAAFPGAFTPVMLRENVDSNLYMDGGVSDNFGLAGLEEYLRNDTGPTETPEILIISDAGLESQTKLGSERFRPSAMEAVVRAMDILYAKRRQSVLANYLEPGTPGAGLGLRGHVIEAGSVWSGHHGTVHVFWLSLRQHGPRAAINANEEKVVGVASQIGTLTEPSSFQVEAAYWTGAALAHAYLDLICDVIRRKGGSCQRAQRPKSPSLPPEARPWRQVVP